MEWSVRNCPLNKAGSLTPKCWIPKALHFPNPKQHKVKAESCWLPRFVHQGLLPAGWKPSESWPLVLLFAPVTSVAGIWNLEVLGSDKGLHGTGSWSVQEFLPGFSFRQGSPESTSKTIYFPWNTWSETHWASTAVSESDVFLSSLVAKITVLAKGVISLRYALCHCF